MREVRASEVEGHLAQLLDEIEQGKSIVITRRGRRIARIVPENERRPEDVDAAVSAMKELAKEIRAQCGEMTIEEILALRHEGHKY
jgi:prevent-host-death family protein